MSFYSDLAVTATRLLTSFGQTVVFTRPTGDTLNPVTGAYSGGTTTTITGKGVADKYNKDEIDGTIVQLGDVKVYFQATTTAPEQNDNCAMDSIDYRVMNVEPISPGGTNVLFIVQLRV